jgi:oligopeptide/dipeptide ABC transporter ATP-binding protein
VSSKALLEVNDLKVSFRTEDGIVRAVDGISFTVHEGEVLGIVGESGSGKSVTMMSVMRLITDPNVMYEGSIVYKGRDLMGLSRDAMREVRGEEIAMIFQDPMTSLNPVYTVGWQIEEQLREHYGELKKGQARGRAVQLLEQVGIPNAEQRVDDYPHQFSGGMRQRVMIALALSCNPDLLIADEPTTALDVTIQAQILELIKKLKQDFGSAVVLITHDLGVVADIADRILVMYAGRIVEEGDKEQVFYDPQHPYTWGLLGSIARLDRPKTHRLTAIAGQPPSMINRPRGCNFRPRCPQAFDRCRVDDPALTEKVGGGHLDACHLAVEDKRARRGATINPELAESA